jgi:hypothetical protein
VGHTRDYFSTAFEVIKMKRHSTHSRVWEYKDSEEVASSTTSLASLSRSSSKGCREVSPTLHCIHLAGHLLTRIARARSSEEASDWIPGLPTMLCLMPWSKVVRESLRCASSVNRSVPSDNPKGTEPDSPGYTSTALLTRRLVSLKDVTVEPVGDTHTVYLQGMWDRAGGGDTAGGPLRVVTENKGIKTNPKWCQNPQYWLKIPSCSSQATGEPVRYRGLN